MFSALDWQVYIASLDAGQIKRAKANPIEGIVENAFLSIQEADLNDSLQKRDQAESVDGHLFTPPREQRVHRSTGNGTATLNKRAVVTQVASPNSLRLISKPRSGENLEYVYDDTATGSGVMIYALDSGVLATHQVRTGPAPGERKRSAHHLTGVRGKSTAAPLNTSRQPNRTDQSWYHRSFCGRGSLCWRCQVCGPHHGQARLPGPDS